MGKVEDNTQKKYARVMHHIGGHVGSSSADDMIQGGEDVLNLLDEAQLQQMADNDTDIQRLINLGALREATPDEVNKWEVSKGIREAGAESTFLSDITATTTGDTTNAEKTGGEGTGGIGSAGSQSYKGLTKGELSEYNVPELKEFAKEEKDANGEPAIPGYATMLKDDLLNALLALGK